MGKKRVAQPAGNAGVDEKIKEQADRASQQSKKRKLDEGTVFINATYNNTMVTMADAHGNVIAWSSAGSLGFSGPKKATPFAASKVVTAVVEKVKKYGQFSVHAVVRGVGSGRDSALRTLAAQGFNILSITDATPIPHNGPRPKKRRRI